VAIPCYNEAAAIGDLVARWRAVLPEAEIVVFDNNSTDATAILAHAAGARVVAVVKQGKGHVVQAIFEQLRDRPAVVLSDGDGTYPPEEALRLLAPILDGQAEMVVARRFPVVTEGIKAMNPIRGLGNRLLTAAFRLLVGPGPDDLLSGYRAFSPTYLHKITPRSPGFEIETELTGAAVARGFRIVEVDVPYHPRAAGTHSKLRVWRDGARILFMIVRVAARLRPLRVAILAGLLMLVTAGVVALLRVR
jgi:glycosyltransferase involved in cell wall biosynthesis